MIFKHDGITWIFKLKKRGPNGKTGKGWKIQNKKPTIT